MVYSLTWLPEVLQKAGLKISEVADWRTRGRAEMGRIRGVIVHHTAGAAHGNMPSLDLLVRGRPDLSGPLAQLGLGRDGTFYIIAAGRANHAGKGVWRGVETGNSSFIGIECENGGKAGDAWPQVQLDALRQGVAAILQQIGADSSMVCGHKEFALPKGRKSDPVWEMAPFRESVAAVLAGGVAPAPLIRAADDQARPTLRRGAQGALVATLQALLGIADPDGKFGPVTEAMLRAWQRGKDLVPDGIAGPKTWATIDPAGKAGVEAAVATAVSTPVPAPSTPVAMAGPLPIADDAAHPVTIDGRHLVSPEGQAFAIIIPPGKFPGGPKAKGETTFAGFVAAHPDVAAGFSRSVLRAVAAVVPNEGAMEAVNAYDRAFLSFGIMQWTAGAGGNEGELAALLARLQRSDGAAFDECFGRFGLSARAAPGAMTGRLSLGGADLLTSASKAALRSNEWTYRFWRAGHHPAVRLSQVAHAGGRIDLFINQVLRQHPIKVWLNSELGVALALDQHVNRPSDVPVTVGNALTALFAGGGVPSDPADWGQAEEDRLVDYYIAARNKTPMTDAATRAARIVDLVRTGKLSATRGSFA